MIACIEQSFPSDTGISKPQGGSVIWLELPGHVDSEDLFDAAMAAGISIVPGSIFSAGNRYRKFIRMSFGHPWSEAIESGIEELGQMVRSMTVSPEVS